MQTKEFSPFYSREYHHKKNESEERLIFRWLQLIEQRSSLYNVINKHDCLRHDRQEKERARLSTQEPRLVVIQPFRSVSNFYGCLVCGKYHICKLRRESCTLVVGELDKQKACGFSGQMLPVQDNLEAIFEDDSHFNNEADYYALPKYMTATQYTSSSNSSNKKNNSPNSKKPHKRHVMELFKEKEINTGGPPPKKLRLSTGASKETCKALVRDLYDLSLESLSEEEEGEKTPNVSIEQEQEEGEGGDEVEVEVAVAIATEAYVEKEATNDIEEDLLAGDNNNNEDSGCEEGGGGGATEYENVNGEGSHAKNYHNNIRYKNDYYSFLLPAVAKQKTMMDRYDAFIDLYKRDMKEEEPLYRQATVEEAEEVEVETPSPQHVSLYGKLNDSVCNKIQEEVHLIVKTLIKIDLVNKPLCRVKPSVIRQTLCTYFTTLVKNITLLLYESPVLHNVAHKRSTKNQNQVSKFTVSTIDLKSAEQPQSNVDYHEYTLCPAKIARALLLRLFIEPYSIMIHGYRVAIWGRDQWLRSFPNLIHDYYSHHKDRHSLDRFEKETNDTGALIMSCLAHYNACPLWLRHMIFLDC